MKLAERVIVLVESGDVYKGLRGQASKLNQKAMMGGIKKFKHKGKEYTAKFDIKHEVWIFNDGAQDVGRYTNKVFSKAKKDFTDYLDN